MHFHIVRNAPAGALLLVLLLACAIAPPAAAEEYVFAGQWGGDAGSVHGYLPMAVAVDTAGNIYEGTRDTHQIVKRSPTGKVLARWGGDGTGSEGSGAEDGQFNSISGIAVDAAGNVYVADAGNYRIQKFSSDGTFLAKWGGYGSGDQQFGSPKGIAVDTAGNVYVADPGNARIQKFSSNGDYLDQWGSRGAGPGQFGDGSRYGYFSSPWGVAVDPAGNVYVTDPVNDRVQSFTPNGDYLDEWGSTGTGDGQFQGPAGIAIDREGAIYVFDCMNFRVQKFAPNGMLIARWGSAGSQPGQFGGNWWDGSGIIDANSIAVGPGGIVYVADKGNSRIQLFRSDGVFIRAYEASGYDTEGMFSSPRGLDTDREGNVYVADPNVCRIQKFARDGTIISQWGAQGSIDGRFDMPVDVAVDGDGYVYVIDYHRVEKFTSSGDFVASWGSYGSEDGQLNYPYGIAVDGAGNVYVADTGNRRVQKFSSDGTFLTAWGGSGPGDGQFSLPQGIAVDNAGNVYVTDTGNHRIQKFTSNGTYVTQWGIEGAGPGQFYEPYGIAVDRVGDVYVTDVTQRRIQKFSADGTFIACVGEPGSGDGQFDTWGPIGVAADDAGTVFATDQGKNRVEKFVLKSTTPVVTDLSPSWVERARGTRVQVYGFRFVPGMQVRLARNGTTVGTADSVVYSSSTMLVSTFDLSSMATGVYDVVAEWPDHTVRSLASGLCIGTLPEGVLHQNDDLSLRAGETATVHLALESPQNLFVTLQKTRYAGDPHYNWPGTVTLERDGVVVATDSGDQDQVLQVTNPLPGNYTVSVTAGSAGHAILKVRDRLPVLTPGEWVVETIQRPYGSVFYRIEVPTGQSRLQLDAQALGGWSRFRVFRTRWGGDQQWIGSGGPDASLTIPNPKPGLYVIEFMDTQQISRADQARDVMLRASMIAYPSDPVPVYLPAITGFSPAKGGNTGTVSMTLQGAWLDPNATVTLDRDGRPALAARSVIGAGEKTSLTATFDLSGMAPGSYTVNVTNPDGLRALGETPFAIEAGGRSDFWVEVVGRETIRTDRPATFILKYGNKGTLDMPAPLISIAADPASSAVSIRFPSATDPSPMTAPVTVIANGSPETPGVLPAGSSFSRVVEVVAHGSEEFGLIATPLNVNSVYSPTTLESVTDASAPAPGVQMLFSRSFPSGYSSYLGPFGYGWVHSFDLHLDSFADGSIVLRSGDRYTASLRAMGNGTYIEEGGDRSLTLHGDGTSTLTLRGGGSVRFGTNRQPTAIIDPNGNQLTLTYTSDRLTVIEHSDGDRFSIEYTPEGRIATLTDYQGKRTRYSYDAGKTLLTSVTAPDGGITTYTYDSQDAMYGLMDVTVPGGIARTFRHDGDGRVVETSINSTLETKSFSYEEPSRTTTIRDAAGSALILQMNENGQLVQSGKASGNTMRFGYDGDDDLVAITDALGNTHHLTYDDKHHVQSITDPLGHMTALGYESRFDTVESVTDPRGNIMNFSFDSAGNLIRTAYPDSRTESRAYDARGNTIQRTDRKGEAVRYQYTNRGQLARIDYPDGSSAAYTYDDAGNILTATNPAGTISMTYNNHRQPTSIQLPDGNSFTYFYDSAGRLIQRREGTGDVTQYYYDRAGNLIRVSDRNDGVIVAYTYDAAGRVIRRDLRSGAFTLYGYDADGRLSALKNYNPTGSELSRFENGYDAAGNLVQVDSQDGRYRYEYDAAGQLVKTTYPDGKITSYEYDASGNRIAVIADGATDSYMTNVMNQYKGAGSTTFTYDANGNMVSRKEGNRTTTFEYNYDNRLIRVSSPEGVQEYVYDALGNRVGLRRNGILTRYLVDPLGIGNVVAEFAEN
ncbi:MAG: 6-bladed beta-propeller, partial [Methanospirillum sp.]